MSSCMEKLSARLAGERDADMRASISARFASGSSAAAISRPKATGCRIDFSGSLQFVEHPYQAFIQHLQMFNRILIADCVGFDAFAGHIVSERILPELSCP